MTATLHGKHGNRNGRPADRERIGTEYVTAAQIAAKLGCSEAAARTRVKAARVRSGKIGWADLELRR